MHENFFIDDDLKIVCNDYLTNTISKILDLKSVNDEIISLLDNPRWQGEKHDICSSAIDMIENYRYDLEKISTELKQCIDDVVSDAEAFADNSDKVASIMKV